MGMFGSNIYQHLDMGGGLWIRIQERRFTTEGAIVVRRREHDGGEKAKIVVGLNHRLRFFTRAGATGVALASGIGWRFLVRRSTAEQLPR